MSAPARQVQVLKLTFRPGKLEEFTSWVKSLQSRKAEVEAAVDAETIRVETLFQDSAGAVYMYQIADDLAFAAQALQASDAPVDLEAKAMFAQCVLEVEVIQPLLHVDRG